MKRIPPLAPITLELRKRLGEIIAERPPQEIASKASGRLGEIIEERIAGLPPEQRIEVAQLTILEILLTTPSALATPPRPEVPLTGLLRRHVALELARLWTRSGWAKIERQRELMHIETLYSLAKLERKNKYWQKAQKAGNPLPTWFERSKPEEARKRAWRRKRAELEKGFERPALDVVADYVGKSPEALLSSLKRGRRARKKP